MNEQLKHGVKAEMVSTTNDNFQHHIGRKDLQLTFIRCAYIGSLKTSWIESYEYQEQTGLITVNTRNSTYVFKILEDIGGDCDWKLSQETKDEWENDVQSIDPRMFMVS